MRYAIYRIHYGLDFLGKSIESVIDEVDKVFVFWSKRPWFKQCKDLPPLNENVLIKQSFGKMKTGILREIDQVLHYGMLHHTKP